MSTFTPSDPLWTSQWYLNNTGQRGGDARIDLKLMAAWSQGFNGQGIRVAINDDGIDLTHPDLVANIDVSKVYDTNRDLTGQGFVTSQAAAHQHGTVVGSIVGMAANGIGGIGIAYKATLIPGIAVLLLDNIPANAVARLFAANLAAGADVSVNSWGADPAFAENFGASGSKEDREWGDQLLKAATEGRAGLGMVIEVSAGNERGNRADASLSNFTSNKVTITVGAVDETGKATDYSTPGASLLVTAFGGVASSEQSENRGFGIVSADVQGASGYNKTSGAEGDYAYQSEGTSYSGPMVGAAAALMLQANTLLGFRDVSAILAMTARQTDPSSTSWVTNGATHWNLGGMHFSRDYGYGLLDISAAVMLAQSWMPAAATMANWVKAESGPRTAVVQTIPDDATRSLSVTAQVADVVRIDRVEFDLNLTAVSPSQLKAEITSPSGTTVTLFDRPLTRALKDGAPDPASEESPWPDTFTIGSTAFLGETSAGTWTLKLTDLVSGVQSTFNSLTVRAWGAALSANDQYVLTDEYKGNKTLTDASGLDTINAAAVSHAVQLDLRDSAVSRVGTAGGTLAWGTGTVIENAIGGMAADTLTGNSDNNLLRGNGGADTIDGGAGADTLIGGPGDDSLVGGSGLDTAVLNFARSVYTLSVTGPTWVVTNTTGTDGRDEVSGVERLKFSDSWTALDLGASDSAGSAVLLIGAVLGKDLMLSKRPLMGSVIDLFDQGYTIQQLAGALMRLPIWAGTLTATNSSTDIATYLLTRVNGKAPTAMELAAAVRSIDTDVQGTFLASLALTP
ncbi:MAG: S8 family serine peptidase, partial [Burkholderiales bacterium]|nr:S8 family serine peptidase [Burkholderiales bacterium]